MALESCGSYGTGSGDCIDGTNHQVTCNILGRPDWEEFIIDVMDSYMEDIKERLAISRMVTDSLIKGMVNAVSQEAAETIAAKELEIAELKEAFRCSHCGFVECSTSISLGSNDERKIQEHRTDSIFSNGFCELVIVRGSIRLLNQEAMRQLESLRNHVGCGQFGSKSDTSWLGGVSQENCLAMQSDLWHTLDFLKTALEAISQQVDKNAPAEHWKMEIEISREVEAMVYSTIVKSLREECERRLWDMNSVLSLVDRFKEIPRIRHELVFIKCLVGPENEHSSPQGSMELDHFPRKVSLWDRNGKHEESKICLPETLETSKLGHMNKEELYNHFRTEILKMKREHESAVQQMTEEYFALRRDFLKGRERERGPVVPFFKDKDYEMLKKKISEAISKLDYFLEDSEKLSEFCNLSRETLDNLISENFRLRKLLDEQKSELHLLSSRASDAIKELSKHSLAKENLDKLVGELENRLEEANTEASISEDLYKCILREVTAQIRSDHEDLVLKSVITQEIFGSIYEEAGHEAEGAMKLDCGNFSDFEFNVIQQTFGIVYQGLLMDKEMELVDMRKKCLKEGESLGLLESKESDMKFELEKLVEETNKLNDKVFILENSFEVKNERLHKVIAEHEKVQKELVIANEELVQLMNLKRHQEALVSEENKELNYLKDKLEGFEKQNEHLRIHVAKLTEKLELSESNLENAIAEKTRILEQEQTNLRMLKAKDTELKKQMESVVHVIQGLLNSFKDFEYTTVQNIKWHNIRLENSACHLQSLSPKVNILRRTRLLYKETLENRCSDLQKAEAEVDLLGDEVDTLLNLLEKIYVALDHYSPILQHYPGIIEILKLVRRELSEEPVKALSL